MDAGLMPAAAAKPRSVERAAPRNASSDPNTEVHTRRSISSPAFVMGTALGSLRDGYFATEIHVLDGIQQLDAFVRRPLKRLPPRDQAHAAGALVDHRRPDRFLEIALAGGGAARVDQAGAPHVAVGDLIAREIDRVVGGEI